MQRAGALFHPASPLMAGVPADEPLGSCQPPNTQQSLTSRASVPLSSSADLIHISIYVIYIYIDIDIRTCEDMYHVTYTYMWIYMIDM